MKYFVIPLGIFVGLLLALMIASVSDAREVKIVTGYTHRIASYEMPQRKPLGKFFHDFFKDQMYRRTETSTPPTNTNTNTR